MNCDQILPALHVGRCPSSPDEIETLKQSGITAVLSLQSDADRVSHGIDWPAMRARYFSFSIVVQAMSA